MKRFIGIATILLSALSVMAGPYFIVPFTVNNITTNGSSIGTTATYSTKVTGLLKRVIIDQSGTSTNAAIVLATTTNGPLKYARTLFTADNGTVLEDYNKSIAEQMYQPDLSICTNSYSGIELFNDEITCTTYGALATNVNAKIYLIIEDK